MTFDLKWKIGIKDHNSLVSFGSHIKEAIDRCVGEENVDIIDLFPFRHNWKIRGHIDDNWLAFTIQEMDGSIPDVGGYDENQIASLKKGILPYHQRQFNELYNILGDSWYSFSKFTYVGPYKSPYASWQDLLCNHVQHWLMKNVVPEVERRNKTRVLRAIPEPPHYDIERIYKSCWVLECEIDMYQGTAFSLDGVGIVSCEHVLGQNTMAFKAENPTRKFPVNVVKRHSDIDIAVLEFEHDSEHKLTRGTADNLNIMDHISIAGFPNYRLGDTGVLIPGLVVGFRMVSAIRRILTNAPIVVGNCYKGYFFDKEC